MARELGSRSITANVVAPGFIQTAMTAELTEDRQQQILGSVPLGRYGQTEEIAGVCLFLASEHASYITGAVIPVDGGLGMGH
jgi:3-oxoacyl-[acyl-carrier protein] reductase